jgi:streptomycin 6-kinase
MFTTNIVNIYGDHGKSWLAGLSGIVKSVADKYGLPDLTPIDNLSCNYVLSGFQGLQPIILKLSLDVNGLKQEATALKIFAKSGAVKVLAEDDGLLLLECAVPGNSLKSYFPEKDTQAIRIVCDVMTRLHQVPLPESGTFPHIKDWLNALDQEWTIPAHYLAKARSHIQV